MQTIKLNGWVAEDKDGQQFFYYNEPHRNDVEWCPDHGRFIDTLYILDLGPDWTKSKCQVIDNVIQDPRPDLKVDDPVFVCDALDHEWFPRHFKCWLDDGTIVVFSDGRTSFTSNGSALSYLFYKLP